MNQYQKEVIERLSKIETKVDHIEDGIKLRQRVSIGLVIAAFSVAIGAWFK